jgi:hypothetical protein
MGRPAGLPHRRPGRQPAQVGARAATRTADHRAAPPPTRADRGRPAVRALAEWASPDARRPEAPAVGAEHGGRRGGKSIGDAPPSAATSGARSASWRANGPRDSSRRVCLRWPTRTAVFPSLSPRVISIPISIGARPTSSFATVSPRAGGWSGPGSAPSLGRSTARASSSTRIRSEDGRALAPLLVGRLRHAPRVLPLDGVARETARRSRAARAARDGAYPRRLQGQPRRTPGIVGASARRFGSRTQGQGPPATA